ncbi:12093_t:CDS:2 [Ambispora leptoticha]|uniref:12093_t:CDS:1 n=1 Tax=Ambispora leptoticha TaxID=144679 RepID=A0A9N8V4R6_9GLOM|nr:12093_t:CDS:2 [Ambispora leptoticha]
MVDVNKNSNSIKPGQQEGQEAFKWQINSFSQMQNNINDNRNILDRKEQQSTRQDARYTRKKTSLYGDYRKKQVRINEFTGEQPRRYYNNDGGGRAHWHTAKRWRNNKQNYTHQYRESDLVDLETQPISTPGRISFNKTKIVTDFNFENSRGNNRGKINPNYNQDVYLQNNNYNINDERFSSTSSSQSSLIVQEENPQITKINIFDFDGTLFCSPLPNPNLWDSQMIARLMNVNLIGKGWFQDSRSLDTTSFPEKISWRSWWNETTVSYVRQSVSDPNALTVLLTGRLYSTFHERIKSILSPQNLFFDVISLKPDDAKIQWELLYQQSQLSEKFKGKVTGIPVNHTTMTYKKALIQGLVEHHPSVREISIWEDRRKHISQFKKFLDDFIDQGVIEHGTIHVVRCKKMYLDEQCEIEMKIIIVEDNIIIVEDNIIIVEDNIINEDSTIKDNIINEDSTIKDNIISEDSTIEDDIISENSRIEDEIAKFNRMLDDL